MSSMLTWPGAVSASFERLANVRNAPNFLARMRLMIPASPMQRAMVGFWRGRRISNDSGGLRGIGESIDAELDHVRAGLGRQSGVSLRLREAVDENGDAEMGHCSKRKRQGQTRMSTPPSHSLSQLVTSCFRGSRASD